MVCYLLPDSNKDYGYNLQMHIQEVYKSIHKRSGKKKKKGKSSKRGFNKLQAHSNSEMTSNSWCRRLPGTAFVLLVLVEAKGLGGMLKFSPLSNI